MYEQARRFLPHTVREGHVVGPYTGIAIDAVDRHDRLREQRRRLADRRQELRTRRSELEFQRGTVWSVAAQKRWFPPRNLEALEIRADAALVDQNLYAYRYDTDAGRPVDDGYRVATLHRRDRRFWSGIIRGERAFMRRVVRPQERLLTRILDAERAVLDSWKGFLDGLRPNHRVAAGFLAVLMAVPVAVYWVLYKLQAVVFGGILKAERTLVDKTVDLPVIVKEGAMDTREEFATQSGRRGLLRALLDEEYLTPERRNVILFLTTIMLVFAWMLTELLIRATYPEAIEPKQKTDVVFFYAILTRLALPAPFELILLDAFGVLGFIPTVLVSAVGAVVGSWILFIIGGEANKGIKRLFEDNVILDATMRWLERNAQRFGYVVLGFILAIPFSPDTVPLVVFSLLNLQMRWFLLTVFAATLVRVSTFLYVCEIQDRLLGALCGPA